MYDARFAPGHLFASRYRIVSLVGRGAMGEVYRADDLQLGQTVALKLVSEPVARRQDGLQRLIDEVRLARGITHPNVCRVYDIGSADGWHFLSMEYVDGETLASLLRRIGHLPMAKAIDMARQLCAGVCAAHDRGVLHRDLKPSNIMVDGRGQIRIMDFGLAIPVDAEVREIAGTPAYMSPEQLAGGPVTRQSDLFALGRVLLDILPPGIDPELYAVVHACIAADVPKRPDSAYVVAAALPASDPLALADGAIPTPAMVAAVPTVGALRPAVAWGLFAAVVAGTIGLASQAYRFNVAPAQLPKPPEVLAERARAALGADRPPAMDWAFWWSAAESDSRVRFTYRESTELLVPVNMFRVVTADDPPSDATRSTIVTLSADGGLTTERPARLRPGSTARSPVGELLFWIGATFSFVAAAILAHRNLRAGEGDRTGARRIGLIVFGGGLVSATARAHHVPSFVDESAWLFGTLGWAAVWSAFSWLTYISFEPYVRRWWPHMLISSTRLLAGRWRDSLVGRDVLVGVLGGLIVAGYHATLLAVTSRAAPQYFRVPALGALESVAGFSNTLLVAILNGLQLTLAGMALLALFRLILRRAWLAIFAIIASAISLNAGSTSPIDLLSAAPITLFGFAILLRVGILANATMTIVSGMVTTLPLTLDANAWYFGRSLLVLLVITTTATCGFLAALGGQAAFGVLDKGKRV